MIKTLLFILFLLVSILYPVLIYIGASTERLYYVLPFIAVIFILKALLGNSFNKRTDNTDNSDKESKKSNFYYLSLFITFIAVLLCTASMLTKELKLVLYYPLFVNLSFFTVFFLSLFTKQSIITRLALLKEKTLDDFAVNYTRKVTMVWCMFFIINGATSCYTVFMDVSMWALYNGFISYILMGLLFLIEFLVRITVRKKHEKQNKLRH